MTKQFVVGLVFLLGLTTTSEATIDFQRAAFSLEEVDRLIINENQSLELYRRYHSRSLYRGLFGFGWCSVLDWKLLISDQRKLYLQKCDQSLHPVSSRSIQYNDLELVFDENGQVLRILYKESGKEFKVFYKGEKIIFISLSEQMIPVEQDSQGRIIEIGSYQGQPLKFVYDELHLIQGSGFKYEYSEFSNLTEYSSNTGGRGQLIYNEVDDQLVSWYQDNGCFHRLQYHPKSKGFEVVSQELCTSSDLTQNRKSF